MTWHSEWPDGTKSVKGNKPFGVQNTEYIETTNQIDHYWNSSEGANDGHHKHVQMTMTGTSAVPADAVLAGSMDGAFFVKAKTDVESADNQDTQPYFINNKAVGDPANTAVMQLLGIRAMGHFSVGLAAPFTITTQYLFNVNPSIPPGPAGPVPGIVRDDRGQYTVTFANALPTDNYLVLGGAITPHNTIANQLYFTVRGTASGAATTVKNKTMFKFHTRNSSDSGADPLQCWFICFGG